MKKVTEEKAVIDGPAGRLEALLSWSDDQGRYIAVICHPHPLHGGTMSNKVVHYTARAYHEMGIPVLRFNFRGVGKSEGSFDNGKGETEDLLACAGWMRARFPKRLLLLAGFSFGSYIAANAAAYLRASGLISVAPPVNLYDFTALEKPHAPWLVVQGSEDEVVPADEVKRWVDNTPAVRHLVWMSGASHFFHGRLLELLGSMKAWLHEVVNPGFDPD